MWSKAPVKVLQCGMHLSLTLHPISICILKTCTTFLHNSSVLLFTECQLRTDTTVMNCFGLISLASFLKAYCSAFHFSSPGDLAPELHRRGSCNFFQQGFLNFHDTKQSFEQCQFNDDNSERKICSSWGFLLGEKDIPGHMLEGGGKRQIKVLKIHVLHLHIVEKPGNVWDSYWISSCATLCPFI